MIDLFRAEWIKVVGHRHAMFWLLGIFPTMAILFFLITAAFVKKPTTASMIESLFSNWTEVMLFAWLVPSNLFGRLFLLAFVAFTFAGEYQWETWKNLAPRRARGQLVLVKFFTVSLLVVLNFFIVSLLLTAGGIWLSQLADVTMKPGLDLVHVRSFIPNYLLGASLAFLAFLITGIFAALGAIYSKTILGGTLAGMMAVLIDPAFFYTANMSANLLDSPWLLHFQRLAPSYNIENVRSWLTSGSASSMIDSSFVSLELAPPSDSAMVSLTLLSLWVILGVKATVSVFEHQDIST